MHCVLLPCANGETWAVPVNSVAEVLGAGELSSGRLCWRGQELPVYPPAAATAEHGGTMYAVMLGLRDVAGSYWAIRLQNRRLEYALLTGADLAEEDEEVGRTADTLAGFVLAGHRCVIPDLGALQLSLAATAADPGR